MVGIQPTENTNNKTELWDNLEVLVQPGIGRHKEQGKELATS
jgi:hypothetical protein